MSALQDELVKRAHYSLPNLSSSEALAYALGYLIGMLDVGYVNELTIKVMASNEEARKEKARASL
jgi:hypothetical protein